MFEHLPNFLAPKFFVLYAFIASAVFVHYRGTVTTTGGHGFCGIARKQLLAILQERGAELGAIHHYQHEVEDDAGGGVADFAPPSTPPPSKRREPSQCS